MVASARAAKQRTKIARLVLGLLLTLAGKASAFSDTASLQGALGEWCADAAAAQATYGPISAWDVSAVTGMEHRSPCLKAPPPRAGNRNRLACKPVLRNELTLLRLCPPKEDLSAAASKEHNYRWQCVAFFSPT